MAGDEPTHPATRPVQTPPRYKPPYSRSKESINQVDNWRDKTNEQKAIDRKIKQHWQEKASQQPDSRKKCRRKQGRDEIEKIPEAKNVNDFRSQKEKSSKASPHLVVVTNDDADKQPKRLKTKGKKFKRRDDKRQRVKEDSCTKDSETTSEEHHYPSRGHGSVGLHFPPHIKPVKCVNDVGLDPTNLGWSGVNSFNLNVEEFLHMVMMANNRFHQDYISNPSPSFWHQATTSNYQECF